MPYSADYIKNKLEQELEPVHLHENDNRRRMPKNVLSLGFILGLALLIRLCTSYYPYSGANKPPIYGDYEAQRHWQEITLNLPISQWYSNSSNNDLQYWGLDYPPLTAYHSFIVAHIAKIYDPRSVKLHESRGYESSEHKYFMRLSVLIVDLLIFIPPVLYFSKNSMKNVAALLFYPGIILIDHGHFQYNCVSLGFFIASVTFILQDSLTLASCFFVLALNYKQMELYHALPFFLYILGYTCTKRRFLLLMSVALTVLLTFAVIWAPFTRDSVVFKDALLRLFPFNRGIFEDKVANIWCAINVLYKLKRNISNSHLTIICLATTVCALLPSSLDLISRPSKDKFLLALVNSSLAFFLCSFQVHEKSILLVAVPVLLELHKDPFCCSWFLLISVFSMLPLLIKDELFLAYLATSTIFFTIIFVFWIDYKEIKTYIKTLFGLSLAGVLLISISSVFIEPPRRYPDLHSLIISVYSCCHFLAFLIYFNCKQRYLKDKME